MRDYVYVDSHATATATPINPKQHHNIHLHSAASDLQHQHDSLPYGAKLSPGTANDPFDAQRFLQRPAGPACYVFGLFLDTGLAYLTSSPDWCRGWDCYRGCWNLARLWRFRCCCCDGIGWQA